MLRKLRKFFKVTEPKLAEATGYSLPYDISNSDYIALQRLMKSEDFEVLTKTLDKVVNLYGEQMLTTPEVADIHFLRGKILGIRQVVEFVDELRLKEKDFAEYNQRRENAGRTGVEQRRHATFGTPSWPTERTRTN